jgi:hypothetical protein
LLKYLPNIETTGRNRKKLHFLAILTDVVIISIQLARSYTIGLPSELRCIRQCFQYNNKQFYHCLISCHAFLVDSLFQFTQQSGISCDTASSAVIYYQHRIPQPFGTAIFALPLVRARGKQLPFILTACPPCDVTSGLESITAAISTKLPCN